MVLTPSSLLCVCRAKLLSAEWFHNSFFQFSLAYDCLELFHTVHVVVCYVVHSFHQQMAYATPSQIKKVLNFIATHRGTHTSGFDQKQNQKAGTVSQWEQNHFVFLHSVSVGTIPLLWLFRSLQRTRVPALPKDHNC